LAFLPISLWRISQWRTHDSGQYFPGIVTIPRWRNSAVATPAIKAENSKPKAMSDKNPKAKQKAQAQHEMLKKRKAEEHQREQQRLHEAHMMKHPHELKG
jgi:hypothetical protein